MVSFPIKRSEDRESINSHIRAAGFLESHIQRNIGGFHCFSPGETSAERTVVGAGQTMARMGKRGRKKIKVETMTTALAVAEQLVAPSMNETDPIGKYCICDINGDGEGIVAGIWIGICC